MNEYEVTWRGVSGLPVMGYFYGHDEAEAKRNAVSMGVNRGKILSVKYYGKKGSYGHI